MNNRALPSGPGSLPVPDFAQQGGWNSWDKGDHDNGGGNKFGWEAITLPGLVGDLMNKGQKNPTNEANRYFNRIPGAMQPSFDPFASAGKRALGGYQGASEGLVNDPTGFLNKIGSGYKSSPGYQWNLKNALAGVNNAQAAGGMLGSPQNQQLSAEAASGIASKDYQDYLNHALGLYGVGLGGEQDIFHQGQQASTEYGTNLAQTLAAQGKYAFEGAKGANDANSQSTNNVLGSFSAILPYLLG